MPRSARLRNIAGGLCGSFASRNNDLDGYWVIGKLRLLAEQHRLIAVLLDVLAPSMQPPSAEFTPVLARYRSLLEKLAGYSSIRLEEISAACVTVDFAPHPGLGPSYYKLQWGEQFVLTVTISADGRADGIMRHAGYCRPHDPDRGENAGFGKIGH
jgi:hypothetical protein